jgi:hypothetical protein
LFLLHLKLTELGQPRPIKDESHAYAAAYKAVEILRDKYRQSGASKLNLFLSAPNVFTFILGQQSLLLPGNITLFEYDYDFNPDGTKDLIKTGTKLKAEGEFAFEPHLVVEMERVTPGQEELKAARQIKDPTKRKEKKLAIAVSAEEKIWAKRLTEKERLLAEKARIERIIVASKLMHDIDKAKEVESKVALKSKGIYERIKLALAGFFFVAEEKEREFAGKISAEKWKLAAKIKEQEKILAPKLFYEIDKARELLNSF